MAEIVWLRRDLRRSDLPTLGAATALGGEVAIVFVLDPDGWAALGAPKRTFTARTLLATRAAYEGRLTLRRGDPVKVSSNRASRDQVAAKRLWEMSQTWTKMKIAL